MNALDTPSSGVMRGLALRGLMEPPKAAAPRKKPAVSALGCRDLFLIFLRGGMSFGGGPGIMAALERELVDRRRVVTRSDFLATYALGRIVPSGTMTAMAVAYGHRFAGWRGTLVALAGLVLPALTLTILLTVTCAALAGGPVLALLSATLLPAALAFIVVAALKFGKEVFRPSLDLVLALAAFAGALVFKLHPSVILVSAGLVGALAFSRG
jgi:chromate transporter